MMMMALTVMMIGFIRQSDVLFLLGVAADAFSDADALNPI